MLLSKPAIPRPGIALLWRNVQGLWQDKQKTEVAFYYNNNNSNNNSNNNNNNNDDDDDDDNNNNNNNNK